MGEQKKRLAINMTTILVHIVKQKWREKKLIAILFINIKKVFDYILKK